VENYSNLSEREKEILRCIIQQFILTAAPVGSRNISKRYDIGLSPASIRNIMADLEEQGFINHPHTSAGRVPTDKGYRFYVDTLTEFKRIEEHEKNKINKEFSLAEKETDELLTIASKLLSSITNNVACVLYPNLDSGVLDRIQIVQLSSEKLLVVITINASLIRTITLEIKMDVKERHIHGIQNLLNERLGGLKLNEIRSSFKDRFRDISADEVPLITLFVDSADKIFTDVKVNDKVHIAGTGSILKQPEFESPYRFQSIIELIENKDIVVHIFENKHYNITKGEVLVSIGSENEDLKLEEYSLVKKEYTVEDIHGTLGIIGPKRMEYQKVMAIVDYVSTILSSYLKRNKGI